VRVHFVINLFSFLEVTLADKYGTATLREFCLFLSTFLAPTICPMVSEDESNQNQFFLKLGTIHKFHFVCLSVHTKWFYLQIKKYVHIIGLRFGFGSESVNIFSVSRVQTQAKRLFYRGASVSISGKWWGTDRSGSGLPRPESWSGGMLDTALLTENNNNNIPNFF